MRIAVCVKRVGMIGDDIELTDDGRDVDADYLDYALNEWDSYAVEEALRLRDEHGGDVAVLTVGDEESEQELRQCLAMGADRAIRVWSSELAGVKDPFSVARALAAALDAPDLVLCGAQSGDTLQGATGGALAGLLDLPCVAVVTRLEVVADMLRVHRELEGGILDIVDVTLPAVLTIQTGINSPRYVTLRAMRQMQEREIELVDPGELGKGAYEIRDMRVPDRSSAVSLGDDCAEVASRILALVQEARR